MNEADTRANYTDPQLLESGWEPKHIRREYAVSDGKKIGGGKRAKALYADYLLKYKGLHLAVIEAKMLKLHPTDGLEQAKNYASKLRLRYAYATNGKRIYEFDMIKGKGEYINTYPSPEELYERLYPEPIELEEKLAQAPEDLSDKIPRYYQALAVSKTVEALAKNRKRILLTLATGTGKTFIAFQLVYKLFNSRWNIEGKNRRPKILFLADRNILADQAINTFNHFEKDLVKIDGSEIRKRNGKVPTNFSLYFAIYQAISEKENIGGYYKQYPKGFFDYYR